MKKTRLFYAIALLLLLIGVIFSCQKESLNISQEIDAGIEPDDIELVKKAKIWCAENRTYATHENKGNLDINNLIFEWNKYALDTNKAGQKVLTVPIRSKSATKAGYIELGLIVDKDGNTNGMIKEYMGNPYVGEMTLNLYTGTGRQFESGWYRADTKELFVQNISRFQGAKGSAQRTAGLGGTLEEVVITAPRYYEPPTYIYIPTYPPNPGSYTPSIPVAPGGGGGGSGGSGGTSITNNVTAPCLRQQVEAAINADISNELRNMMKDIYNINQKFNLTFTQSTTMDDRDGMTRVFDGTRSGQTITYLDMEITLNAQTLPNASKEFILSTIYHEILHAIMKYNGFATDLDQQHNGMATNYISRLATALKSHFPNLSEENAEYLSWGGLYSTKSWANLSTSVQDRIKTLNSLHKSGRVGTRCN